MPSPDTIDVKKLTAPVPGDKPQGVDMRADPSPTSPYYAVRDARSAARTAERQQVMGDEEAPPPDWKPVLIHGVKALEKSKDFEVVAYMVEALVRLHGFPGLRDGFRLARELAEQYWDNIYPLPDEEGVDTRVAPLTGLNGDDAEGTLIAPIAQIPLTDKTSVGRFSSNHYKESQALEKVTDPKVKERKLAAGAVSLSTFQKGVQETSSKFYQTLMEDLTAAQEEFTKLGKVLDEKAKDRAPPTSQIRNAIVACQDVIKAVASAKLAPTPKPGEGDGKADGQPGAPGTGGPAGAQPPGEVLDILRTREDAFRALLKIAEFFRKTEPHTIVSYTLEQVVRWGQMSLPDLFMELIPEEAPRKNLFKQVGMKPPEPPKDAAKK
jgi:type VI secretion system protein ImpA